MENQGLKTGTTTVGLVCKDGLVLAADKRATVGNMIASSDMEKVFAVSERLAITTAGSVSDIQLTLKIVKAEIKLKELREKRKLSVKEAANMIAGMVYNKIRSMVPGVSHFLFGGYDEEGFSLYDIFPDGSLTPVKDFIASGSGSVFVYGFFESNYETMSVQEGVEFAVDAVNVALKRDSASGDGIDVVKITKNGVEKVLTKKISSNLKK